MLRRPPTYADCDFRIVIYQISDKHLLSSNMHKGTASAACIQEKGVERSASRENNSSTDIERASGKHVDRFALAVYVVVLAHRAFHLNGLLLWAYDEMTPQAGSRNRPLVLRHIYGDLREPANAY